MAKKKSSEKSGKGKDDKELEKKHKAEADTKAAKAAKAEKRKQKQDAKAEGKDAKGKGKDTKGKGGTAEPAARQDASTAAPQRERQEGVDQVAILKLALRDTEGKLVAAEHRLQQVQQQLDDERRARAEATDWSSIEAQEAVVDAAVAETVAEAVVAAELAAVVSAYDAPVDAASVAAATLEDAADAIDAALATDPAPEGPGDAATGAADTGTSQAARSDLTPPLPEHGSETEPSEAWTLVHLRKEADRRGITGVSNLPKAALIERLRA